MRSSTQNDEATREMYIQHLIHNNANKRANFFVDVGFLIKPHVSNGIYNGQPCKQF